MTLRGLLLLGLVVLALTGCAAERRVLTAHGAGIDVTVDDRTGWAVGASMVEPRPRLDPWTTGSGQSVQVRNLDDAVLQIAWTGGGCHEPATVLVDGHAGRARDPHPPRQAMHDAGARVPRVLRLTFDRAIDASTVDASGRRAARLTYPRSASQATGSRRDGRRSASNRASSCIIGRARAGGTRTTAAWARRRTAPG